MFFSFKYFCVFFLLFCSVYVIFFSPGPHMRFNGVFTGDRFHVVVHWGYFFIFYFHRVDKFWIFFTDSRKFGIDFTGLFTWSGLAESLTQLCNFLSEMFSLIFLFQPKNSIKSCTCFVQVIYLSYLPIPPFYSNRFFLYFRLAIRLSCERCKM